MLFLKKKTLGIFLVFWIIYSIFAVPDRWNDNSSLDLTIAIVDEHRFELDSYAGNTGDLSYYKGHYYSDKPPGTAFLAVPLYSIYKFFFGKIPYYNSLDEDNPSWRYKLFLFLVISLISAVCGALTVVLVYKTTTYFTQDRFYQNLIVLTYGLCTLQLHTARQFNTNTVSTFFIFLCFYLVFKTKMGGKDYSFLAGFVGGYAILSSYLIIVLLIFCFIFIISTKKGRYILKFILGSLIFISVFLLYHYIVYDNPLSTSYGHSQNIWVNTDYVDLKLVEDLKLRDVKEDIKDSYCYLAKYDFQFWDKPEKPDVYYSKCSVLYSKPLQKYNPLLRKFYRFFTFKTVRDYNISLRLLFWPYRGLFFYFPVLLLSFPGLIFLPKKYRLIRGVIIPFLFYIVFFSVFTLWWMGSSFGPKNFAPLIPFLMIPLLFCFRKVNSKIMIFFVIISALISIIGLQSVYLSYSQVTDLKSIGDEYIQKVESWKPIANPLFENYIPNLFHINHRELLLEQLLNINLIPFINIALLLLFFFLIYKIIPKHLKKGKT